MAVLGYTTDFNVTQNNYPDLLSSNGNGNGGIIIQYKERPIAILVSEKFFTQSHPDLVMQMAHFSLEGITEQKLTETFMKETIIKLRDQLEDGFQMDISTLGKVILVRLDLLDLEAFCRPSKSPSDASDNLLSSSLDVTPKHSSCAIFPDEVDESTKYREGAVKKVQVNAYERDSKARQRCIDY